MPRTRLDSQKTRQHTKLGKDILPIDIEGKTHIESTKGLCKVMQKYLANEQEHRELIRAYTPLASSDPDMVLLAALGMCGLRAVTIAPGQIAAQRPHEMSRKVYRQKLRLAERLAARSLKLIHGIAISELCPQSRRALDARSSLQEDQH